MELINNEISDKEVTINFVDEKGALQDLVIFKDVNGTALGIAVVNDHNFSIPDGTAYCDYYHQSEHQKDYITRCVLGEIVIENDEKLIVRVAGQGQTREFNAKDKVDFVKVANNKDDFMTLIVNETFSKIDISKENEESKSRSIA